jgi:hypothetical protein
MALNTAGDLGRAAWDAPCSARATCEDCGVVAEGSLPPTIKAKAREHARSTGHVTQVTTERITEYTPVPKEASNGN